MNKNFTIIFLFSLLISASIFSGNDILEIKQTQAEIAQAERDAKEREKARQFVALIMAKIGLIHMHEDLQNNDNKLPETEYLNQPDVRAVIEVNLTEQKMNLLSIAFSSDNSLNDLKKAQRKLSLQNHPDKFVNKTQVIQWQKAAQFKELNKFCLSLERQLINTYGFSIPAADDGILKIENSIQEILHKIKLRNVPAYIIPPKSTFVPPVLQSYSNFLKIYMQNIGIEAIVGGLAFFNSELNKNNIVARYVMARSGYRMSMHVKNYFTSSCPEEIIEQLPILVKEELLILKQNQKNLSSDQKERLNHLQRKYNRVFKQ